MRSIERHAAEFGLILVELLLIFHFAFPAVMTVVSDARQVNSAAGPRIDPVQAAFRCNFFGTVAGRYRPGCVSGFRAFRTQDFING